MPHEKGNFEMMPKVTLKLNAVSKVFGLQRHKVCSLIYYTEAGGLAQYWRVERAGSLPTLRL
jgi:hypothetical protein